MKNPSIENTEVNTIEEDFVVAPNEYHFAGGGEYEPITIKAASIAEATAKWEEVKVAVGVPKDLSITK